MITRAQAFIFYSICAVLWIDGHPVTPCNRLCGASARKHFPYPFGFSPGCPIQLNCTSNSAAVGEFPVQDVTPDVILINLPAKCHRPIETLGQLFGPHFAPTSHNGILLQNCSKQISGCLIPTTMVQTHFELLDCGSENDKNNNISCYSEQNKENRFIDFHNVTRTRCRSLFSAISAEAMGNGFSSAVSLDVQMVQLGWWLNGNCGCSSNANCTTLLSPVDGRQGYRCQCLEGFIGDGYRDGLGCRKEFSACNLARYMSGRCTGAARVGLLVGGIVAGACLMISTGLICCFIRRRSNSKRKKRTSRRLSEAMGISIPIYPYKEVEKATDFFSDKQRLGTGAFGTVYAGKLHEEWVAIKRNKHRDTDSTEQVLNEIKLLSSVSHPNLVRLRGCSIDKGEQVLVYEFMPNGTLSEHLQKERSEGLPWPVRLNIAVETAQAIAHLHSSMNPPIFHRDIKSSNILLDYDFKSKVADFGLSRLGMTESSHISTAPQGTPGYLDPQYHQNFHLSDKSDVYSFGVVLVEMITALKAVDFSRPPNEINLASLAMDRIGKGRLDEIIDPMIELHRDVWTLSSLHKVAEMAFRCLAFDRDMRPPMTEVADELEQIKLSRWASSDENITASSDASSGSSSSNESEKPLKKPEVNRRDLYPLQIEANSNGTESMEEQKKISPASIQDLGPSDQSSPSSSSFLGHMIR